MWGIPKTDPRNSDYIYLGALILPGRFRVVTISSGTLYTKPSDVVSMFVMVRGATSGSRNVAEGTGGGGGGGYSELYLHAPDGHYSYSIGAAGVSGSTGATGGLTTFSGISITSSGGVAGLTGGTGGVATGGQYNANGGAGGNAAGLLTGGGGGGSAGSRAGAGFAGGNSPTNYGGGGGGAGTGGDGAAGGATAGGAGGIAATTEHADTVKVPNFWKEPTIAGTAGTAGGTGDGTAVGGLGWVGVAGTITSGAAGMNYLPALGGSFGSGKGNAIANNGGPGLIYIWEILS